MKNLFSTAVRGFKKGLRVVRKQAKALAVAGAALVSSTAAYAQTDPVITNVVETSSWTQVIADIALALAAVMVPIIGLAVGLMLVAILFKVLKKFLFAGK